MKIIIFPEDFVYRQLALDKPRFIEAFQELRDSKELGIVCIVRSLQHFCFRLYSARIEYKNIYLVVSSLAEITTQPLEEAIAMVNGCCDQAVLVSFREDDSLPAKELGMAFIHMENLSALPGLLNLN